MVIIKMCILYYYFQLHVSAPYFGAIFRLNSIFLIIQCIQLTVLLQIAGFRITYLKYYKINFAIFYVCNYILLLCNFGGVEG